MNCAAKRTVDEQKRGKKMRSRILALCCVMALPAMTAAQTPNNRPPNPSAPGGQAAARKVGAARQGTGAPSRPAANGQTPAQRPASAPATPLIPAPYDLTTPPATQPEGAPVLSGQTVPILGGEAILLLGAPVTGSQAALFGYGGGPVTATPNAMGLPTLSLPQLSLSVLSFSGATTPGFVPIQGGMLMLPPAGTTLPVSRVIPTLVPEEAAAPAGTEPTESARAGRPAAENGSAARPGVAEPFVNILGGTPAAILDAPLTGSAAFFRPYVPGVAPSAAPGAGGLPTLGLSPLGLPTLGLPQLAPGAGVSATAQSPAAAVTQQGVTLPRSRIIQPASGTGAPTPIPTSRAAYAPAAPLPGLRTPAGFRAPSLTSPPGFGALGGLRLPSLTSPYGLRGLNLPGLGGFGQLLR